MGINRGAKGEVFQGTVGPEKRQHYFHVQSANGEIQFTGEGYTRHEDAERGFDQALLNAVDVAVQRGLIDGDVKVLKEV